MFKQFFIRLGYDVVRTDNFVKYAPARRMKLIFDRGIGLVLDVGANIGQYAKQMRELGYRGRIVSFEPLSSAYSVLEQESAKDSQWQIVNMGLGDEDCTTQINISGNSYSSSLLQMKPAHIAAEPQSQYIGSEEITLRKLDTVFNEYYRDGEKVYLKLDTQGFEKHVMEGAVQSLDRVDCIQMEMSLVPLYETELLLADMIDWMKEKGFLLWALENEFAHPKTGQLLQVNGIFVRGGNGDR
jgi:FkbM family methyltransferase